MSISYRRRGLVSWNLSCKFPLHFTNLRQTDSFWALPKILHHRKWPLRSKAPSPAIGTLVPVPLCKPACKLCANRNVPSSNWSKFLYNFYTHHFNFKTKMIFLCKRAIWIIYWEINETETELSEALPFQSLFCWFTYRPVAGPRT